MECCRLRTAISGRRWSRRRPLWCITASQSGGFPLSQLADAYGTTVSTLASSKGISHPNRLIARKVLIRSGLVVGSPRGYARPSGLLLRMSK